MKLPSERVLNQNLSNGVGREVVLFEVMPVAAGNVLRLTFDRVDSSWRQGVRIATDGELEVNGSHAGQLVIWSDTAPAAVRIGVVATDGLLRLYNVWDSGRGLGDHESQSATSGMLVDEEALGMRRYRCNDIGSDPTFDKLIFTLEHTPAS